MHRVAPRGPDPRGRVPLRPLRCPDMSSPPLRSNNFRNRIHLRIQNSNIRPPLLVNNRIITNLLKR